MIQILIADDHTLLRDGLNQIIADTNDLVVKDQACTGEEALEKIRKNDYDVILQDIELPGINGLDVIKQVKQEKPEIAILVLTMYPEEQYAIRALKAGASGYFTKDGTPDELIDAIRKVAQGGRYISASLAEKLAFYFDKDHSIYAHEKLSQREYQVMLKIAEGKTLKEIAKDLTLGVTTISTYRRRILEKMEMKHNIEIAHYAIRHDLIKPQY
jgi:DNA-binding NarL/FixJ family response regulator